MWEIFLLLKLMAVWIGSLKMGLVFFTIVALSPTFPYLISISSLIKNKSDKMTTPMKKINITALLLLRTFFSSFSFIMADISGLYIDMVIYWIK
ncbi:wsv135 [White spot syndrome virus]|uniref:Wsv135 n=5 Tax=White spot syndrome virus TaxID=342409 RepID=Q8VB58_WSSVS|nr:wsv135 [Shrimp white spot syndrome virus]AFX59511.1 wsv135 [White spot syndrome virus]AAL33139.1 wsv135 [Shrimp white spot syndrome virus]AAL89058.1 WSSV190 [Shrimp white spot syndrome virus]AWQ60734.1 wsv135 [Shrimp white spot syndrome virus]AWQ61584.1 wsv135 [Shrimp white spot syndrome virus]